MLVCSEKTVKWVFLVIFIQIRESVKVHVG